jgi:hypothetical protein
LLKIPIIVIPINELQEIKDVTTKELVNVKLYGIKPTILETKIKINTINT